MFRATILMGHDVVAHRPYTIPYKMPDVIVFTSVTRQHLCVRSRRWSKVKQPCTIKLSASLNKGLCQSRTSVTGRTNREIIRSLKSIFVFKCDIKCDINTVHH